MIVQAKNLSKQVDLYGSKLVILDNVCLEIASGQSAAITGPSGAGKSTLLALLAGLDTPSNGTVILGNQDIFALTEDERTIMRGKNLGFVFQSFYLLDNLTALENVMLPLELNYQTEAQSKAIALLQEVGLGDRLQHYPSQLSGGEQQRVALARAFVTRPAILFADEPTGNLDQVTGELIADKLFELNKNFATTLVIITHEPTLAARCDKIININKGKIY